MKKYRIADIIIEMNYPDELISEEFRDFEVNVEAETDIYWTMECNEVPDIPNDVSWIRFDGFDVTQNEQKVYARYHKQDYYMVDAIVYENQYRKATLFFSGYSRINNDNRSDIQFIIMAYQREMFFFALLSFGGISIHSASIIYGTYGIIFSALSGTGKSTHTNLWNRYYGTPILDGDVTVCRVINGVPYIYGLPWSGSSGLYQNKRVPLKAVVFLSQGKVNKVQDLSKIELFKYWLARSFASRWFSDIVQKETVIIQEIVSLGVLGFTLSCDISKDAVDTVKNQIDRHIRDTEVACNET